MSHTELERVGERLSSVVPPQNLEAEESVLGAMLLSPVAVGTVSEILDASDFYRESHAKMYRAALALWSKGEPVDAITLSSLRLFRLDNLVGSQAVTSIALAFMANIAFKLGLIGVAGGMDLLRGCLPALAATAAGAAVGVFFFA